MRNTLLFLLLALTSITISAKANANEWPTTSQADIELAKRYNDLINVANIEEAKKLLADEVEFSDPTWGAYNQNKAQLIQAFDPKQLKGYHNLQYQIRNIFTSKGTVVIQMIASADVDPPGVTDPEKRVHSMIDFVRVIEVKNGKVVRQYDLAGYDSAMPKITAAAKK